jgi:hypothetical protein
MMVEMSQVMPTTGQERTGAGMPPSEAVTPEVRARAIRAQQAVFLVMVILILLPVAVWFWMNQ